MGIAHRLAGNDAQAEALAGVIARRFQPAIVEQQALALAVLEIELAVVAARYRFAENLPRRLAPQIVCREDIDRR